MTLPVNLFGDKKIKVVRHAGDLNQVTLEDGKTVYRLQEISIPNMGTFKCAPMDNHFIFRHIYKDANGNAYRGWTLFCTCGSPAGVAGYDAYKDSSSQQGELLVCLHHSTYGSHADGSH